MKKQRSVFFFNLVEIALAMAVIGIGMSSILVLFPVGINSSKDSVANNNLADIAEYTMNYLRVRANAEWQSRLPANAESSFGTSSPFLSKIPTSNSDLDALDTSGAEDWTAASSENKNYCYYESDGKRLFRFQQITDSNAGADFSAIIRVWKKPLDFMVVDVSKSNTSGVGDFYPVVKDSDYVKLSGITQLQSTLKQKQDDYLFGVGLFVEISWPSEAPYDKREKRVFYMEVYNEYLNLQNITQ